MQQPERFPRHVPASGANDFVGKDAVSEKSPSLCLFPQLKAAAIPPAKIYVYINKHRMQRHSIKIEKRPVISLNGA
jgi:hypothetical protein